MAGRAPDRDPRAPVSLVGSPVYLAPEVLAGHGSSPRSDLYSLGVLLFRLASGSFPVTGTSLVEIKDAHAGGRRTRLADLRPALPAQLFNAIERAISTNPQQRFASAQEMEQALRVRIRRPARRQWAMASGAVVIVAAILAGLLVSRPRTPALPFAERDWVLIAPFENQTGDTAFDGVLEQAFERELVGSGFVNVVSRARVEDSLSLMRKPPDARLDHSLAREVCLRDGGIRALLTGRLTRVGRGYTLTTTIVNPADGTTVAAASDDIASADELIARIRQQALHVRQTLGEALASVERSQAALHKVTTPSLAALQLYSTAATLLEGEHWQSSADALSRYQSAEGLLKQATERDPAFAMAWLLRAHAACRDDVVVTTADCLPLAERAFSLAESASPVERYFIEGYVSRRRFAAALGRRGDLMAAARAYEALLQLVPDHYWALLELEPVYQHLGRLDDAGRTTLRAAAGRPNSLRFAIDTARVHLRRHDQPALAAAAARALSLVPAGAESVSSVAASDITWLRLWRAHAAWLNDDAPGALAAAQEAERQWPYTATGPWLYQLSQLYQGLGRFDDALRLAERMDPSFAAFTRSLMAARREDWAAVRRLVRADTQSRPGILIFAGMTREAERVVAEDRRRGERRPWQYEADFIGQLRVAQGRFAEGWTLLEPLTQPEPRPRYKVLEAGAIARRALGDVQGAIDLLEPLGASRASAVSYVWSASDWLRCRTLLVELYDQAGRAQEADAVDAEVRRLLAVADPGDPMIRRLDARRR